MPGGNPYSYSSNLTPSGTSPSKYKGPSYTGKRVESSDNNRSRPKPYMAGAGGGSGGAKHASYPTKQTGQSIPASKGAQNQMKGSKMAKRQSRHAGGEGSYRKG